MTFPHPGWRAGADEDDPDFRKLIAERRAPGRPSTSMEAFEAELAVQAARPPLPLVVPRATAEALARYLDQRLRPGGFLCAVLSNDLTVAVLRADRQNGEALPWIVRWMHEHAPGTAWGSPAAVESWLSAGPVRGAEMSG